MSEKDLTTIPDAKVIRETDAAILVDIDGAEFWIPKACVADESEIWSMKNAGPGDLVIPTKFAEQKGLA